MEKVYLRRRNTVKGLTIHKGKSFKVQLAGASISISVNKIKVKNSTAITKQKR